MYESVDVKFSFFTIKQIFRLCKEFGENSRFLSFMPKYYVNYIM